MKTMNWQSNQAEYIKKPLFLSYGNFQEKRTVLVDCSFGVNPLGGVPAQLSPEDRLFPVAEARVDFTRYSMYPSDGAHGNRRLAAYVLTRWPALNPDGICFSSGSYGGISNLGRILGGARSKIRGFLPQFIPALMEFATAGASVETRELAAPDYRLDVDEILAALDDDVSLLYLDNPHNPTGRVMSLEELSRLAKGCARRGTLLLVDEAYADFVDDANSALNLTDENVICVRSFSKGCGLAGLRVGFIHIRDKELLHCYRELGLQFGSSALAADLAAEVLPQIDLPAMRKKIATLKRRTMDLIKACPGFRIASTHESTPIFLLGWQEPGSLYDKLMDHGIMTEPGHFFAIDDSFVRLRIPGPADFELFERQWRQAFRMPPAA